MSLRHFASLVLAILLAPRLAAAQPALTAPLAERHGLIVGGGLWGGEISCEGDSCGDFREAGGASGHIGLMLTPRLGLLVDVWGMTSSQNDVAITYVAGTLNARLYLVPRLWVQAGLGGGHARVRVSILEARSDDVPVGQLAAGVELIRGDGWSLDLSAKVAQGTATDDDGDDVTTARAAGVGLSVTWFAQRPARSVAYAAR